MNNKKLQLKKDPDFLIINNEKIRKNIEKGEEIINYYMNDDNFEELEQYHRKLKNQNPTDLIQISNSD